MLPGVTIFSPANSGELRECLRKALYEVEGVAAVRYPRGQSISGEYYGEYRLFAKQSSKLIVCYGRIVEPLLAFESDVLQLIRIMPLPEEAIELALLYDDIIFYEEGSERGGIGEALLLELYRRGWRGKYDVKAVTDFVPAAEVQVQLQRIITQSVPLVPLVTAVPK
jgi:1-deoxy-D-xylulose-5-phosphate synthase